MQLINYQKKKDIWVLLLLIVFLFKPSPTSILGPIIGMKFTEVSYLVLFLLFFINYKFKLKDRILIQLLVGLFVVEVISTFKGSLFHDVLISDILEVSRPLFFIISFSFGIMLAERGITLHQKKLAYFILIVFVVFSFAIFLDFQGFKGVASAFYELGKSRGHSDVNVNNIWRLASTFTNPNYFGFACTIITSFLFYRNLQKFSVIETTLCLIFTLFIVLSGSRTSLISFVIVTGMVIVFDLIVNGLKTKKRVYAYSILFIGVFGFVAPKIWAVASDVLWRFTNVNNMQGSLGARFDEWGKALTSIESNLFIGVGSNKSEVKSLDNNYLMILYKNGIVGLMLVLSIMFSSVILAFNLLKKSTARQIDNLANNISVLLLCSTSVFLIGMITAVPFYMSQLSIPYFVLLGYASQLRVMQNNA